MATLLGLLKKPAETVKRRQNRVEDFHPRLPAGLEQPGVNLPPSVVVMPLPLPIPLGPEGIDYAAPQWNMADYTSPLFEAYDYGRQRIL